MAEWTGTEKQIAWARLIKNAKSQDFDVLMREHQSACEKAVANGRATEAQVSDAHAKLLATREAAEAIVDANFWIEHRDTSARQILKEMAGL